MGEFTKSEIEKALEDSVFTCAQICNMCIKTGISLENAITDGTSTQEGPIYSDNVCEQCYQTQLDMMEEIERELKKPEYKGKDICLDCFRETENIEASIHLIKTMHPESTSGENLCKDHYNQNQKYFSE